MDNSSPDGTFQIRVSPGHIDNYEGDGERVEGGVTVRKEGHVQFEKELRSPDNGAIANDGTSVVVQGKNWDKPEEEWEGDDGLDTLYIFESTGEVLVEERMQTAAGIYGCSIDGTGSYVAISGPDEGNVVLYDVAAWERIVSRDYDEIEFVYEIETVKNGDEWVFELTGGKGDPSIFIDQTGEIVPEPDELVDASEEEDSSSEEPLADVLRAHDIPVPNTVFGLLFVGSETDSTDRSNLRRFKALIDQGPIYFPDWSTYRFIIPDPPKALYVVGPESVPEAADGFARLADREQIDFSEWYAVDRSGGTGTLSNDDFEAALLRVSKGEDEKSNVTTNDGSFLVSFDADAALDNLVREWFFGETTPSEGE